MKVLKTIIFGTASIIGAIVLFLVLCILISVVQYFIFVPKDSIIWVNKFPFNRLWFIYEIFIIGFIFKVVRRFVKGPSAPKIVFFNRLGRDFIFTVVVINILLLYTIICNVTVVTQNGITDYKIFAPSGKTYSYKDIVKIDTGVYGKNGFFASYSKGDFYYNIELKDGTRIDLAASGGNSSDEDLRFILERLDKQFVDLGISKTASMENFQYCAESLDKKYTDKIKSILENKR